MKFCQIIERNVKFSYNKSNFFLMHVYTSNKNKTTHSIQYFIYINLLKIQISTVKTISYF